MPPPVHAARDGHDGARAVASPFVDVDRAAWAGLAASTPLTLSAEELESVRGLGERISLVDVDEVYRPLARLLTLHAAGSEALHAATSTFLAGATDGARTATAPRTPFVIGVAGSVAVGKSTTARLLRALLSRWPATPRVELVTTDGFLLPNAELERRGLLGRKGFPESYDRRALLRFVTAVKSGAAEVRAPVYSHLTYDIVPGAEMVVRRPDVLIVEGLNVLAPRRARRHGTGRAEPVGEPGLGAGAVGLLRRLHLRRRAHRRHRAVVRRAVPAPAPDRLRRPRVLLPPLRVPVRRAGPRARRVAVGPDQPAQPRGEHRPHARGGPRWC